MDEERSVPPRFAQQSDYPLGFAKRIDAHQVAALGEDTDRVQQTVNFLGIWRMPKNRKGKDRLSYENVAGQHFKGGAGGITPSLVVARYDNPPTAPLGDHLGRSQHVPRRHQTHPCFAQLNAFSVLQSLKGMASTISIASLNDRKGFSCCQYPMMIGSRMICVPVRDHGPFHGPMRINEKVTRSAVEALGRYLQPVFRMGFALHIDSKVGTSWPTSKLQSTKLLGCLG